MGDKIIQSRTEFGRLLQEQLLKKGIRKRDLCTILAEQGILVTTSIYGYLSGQAFPSLKTTLMAICKELDINPAQLDLERLVAPKYHSAFGITPHPSTESLSSLQPEPLPPSLVPGYQISSGEVLVGESPAMKRVFSLLDSIIRNPNQDAPILILGETGTGKELVAKAIHYQGPLREHQYVGLNITAVPETLLESLLFGHQKGAFTGAVADNCGFFESVGQGTLLLDEIGSLSPSVQGRLLRVLQERVFYRVGQTTPVPFQGRILVSTHENLVQKVRAGSFREDLLYRLDVVQVTLPPLRERREDIPLLFRYFIERYNQQYGTEYSSQLPAEDLERLQDYSFPGNVRELEHLITKAIFAHPDAQHRPWESGIIPWMLPKTMASYRENDGWLPEKTEFVDFTLHSLNGSLSEVDLSRARVYFGTYYDCDGQVQETAKRLNISPRTFYRNIQQFGLDAVNLNRILNENSPDDRTSSLKES